MNHLPNETASDFFSSLLGLQVPAAGSSIVLRPGVTRVAGTEPHAAKLSYESVVAAGDPASKAGVTAKHPFPYRPFRE